MTIKEYNRNKKRAKALTILAPITFWLFIAISLACLIIAIKHSVGNIAEIIDLLDSKQYNGEQIAINYETLVTKYGEWAVGSIKGSQLSFINIKNALFPMFAITNFFLSIAMFVLAFLLGKWAFPYFAKSITQENQDAVNEKILSR